MNIVIGAGIKGILAAKNLASKQQTANSKQRQRIFI